MVVAKVLGLPAGARRMGMLSHQVAREVIALNLNDKRIRDSDISIIAGRLEEDADSVFAALCSFGQFLEMMETKER